VGGARLGRDPVSTQCREGGEGHVHHSEQCCVIVQRLWRLPRADHRILGFGRLCILCYQRQYGQGNRD
jgi:hypothetical protein